MTRRQRTRINLDSKFKTYRELNTLSNYIRIGISISSDYESLEDLNFLNDYDPILEIRNHLDQEVNDYSDDLRIYIR